MPDTTVKPLVTTKADQVLAPHPFTAPTPHKDLRSFGDPIKTRQYIYDDTLKAFNEAEPVSNDRHTLRLTDPHYIDPDNYSRKKRKEAILTGGTIARRVRGTWELVDNATGDVVDRATKVVASVPHMTSMGTFIDNGNDYTVNHQQRLRAGVFTRRKANGEIEAHNNIMPGHGPSHRLFLDPEKGVFKMRLSQAELPLMPIMKMMGATDSQLKEAWGGDLYAANYKENDSAVFAKLRDKLLRKKDREGDERATAEKLREAFKRMKLDPEVMQSTLGKPHEHVSIDTMLDTTKKLLAISRGEADVDDRDHLAYQQVYGPEDLFAERVRRDHGRIRQQLLMKASLNGNLSKLPSGALTPQLRQVLIGSGLGQSLEEINPAEVFDKQSRITRMGEGGIPSMDSVPEESRDVQPSHFGFIDPLRTPESFKAGIDLNMARSAKKGRDGRVYSQFRDPRTGKLEWLNPQQLSAKTIAFPDWLRSKAKRVPVMKGGELTYVKKRDVDFVLPAFEDAFSPLANLVPLKSMVKGQRVAMASRMSTQALPLQHAEAPLVRGALPGSSGSKDFETEYGERMGAVRASQGGTVIGGDDDSMRVRYEDGRTEEIQLYNQFPFNRKTFVHQQSLVKPGDRFKPGQLLAKSNYTDDQGATALGINARVAYMPYHGYNYEDAKVISESMAKRLTSDHAYQHELEQDDRTKVGLKDYVSVYPQKFSREVLKRMDAKGVIKPGQTVNFGEPLILAIREKDRPMNKIHKNRQPGFTDTSVLWQHHDPGVVTDVMMGKNGPTVMVKSSSATQVGDKLTGRFGDKGVVAKIIPDDQMPHDKDGKPFEILENPLGVVSRTNPAQMVEAALGKIAAKTGKHIAVPDFENEEDMTEWAARLMRQHDVSDMEDVYDPKTGKKAYFEHPETGERTGIFTGNRFFMKLHHTAESKGQGRGSGAYGLDESPAKGGDSGCFTGSTEVMCCTYENGKRSNVVIAIGDLVRGRQEVDAVTRCPESGCRFLQPITDWFEYQVAANELVDVELENGERFTVTRSHVMFRADGTKVDAGSLQPGDDLMEG